MKTQHNPQQLDLSMQLSEHFQLHEFVRSGTAITRGIDNTPPREAVALLQALCENVLEPLRRRFGVIRITSGYRCEELNKAVKGAVRSQHLYGEAADIHISSREEGQRMADFLLNEGILFDQAIIEYDRATSARWLHLSYRPLRCRRQVIGNK